MSDDQEVLDRAWAAFERHTGRWHGPLVSRTVSSLSRFLMLRLNTLTIDGLERFHALRDRGARGLLTFSNHVSMFDDPWLISCIGYQRYSDLRWVAAEARNFFDTPAWSWFFSSGKCVPVVRGLGLEQPGFAFLSERLQAGDWVHVFPEGGRTREPGARLRLPFKPGIGRLIDEAQPWVLPFHHVGMDKILPIGAKAPQRGQTVRVRFGEAKLFDTAEVSELTRSPTARERYLAITQWAQDALKALEHAALSA